MVPFVQLFRSSAFRPVVPLNGPYFGGTCTPNKNDRATQKKFSLSSKNERKICCSISWETFSRLAAAAVISAVGSDPLSITSSFACRHVVHLDFSTRPVVVASPGERERANKHRENDFPPTRREFVTDANDRSVPVVDFLVIFELSSCVTS